MACSTVNCTFSVGIEWSLISRAEVPMTCKGNDVIQTFTRFPITSYDLLSWFIACVRVLLRLIPFFASFNMIKTAIWSAAIFLSSQKYQYSDFSWVFWYLGKRTINPMRLVVQNFIFMRHSCHFWRFRLLLTSLRRKWSFTRQNWSDVSYYYGYIP
jgi:hypothetical protein